MDVQIVTTTNKTPVHNLQLPAFPTSLLHVHATAASSALAAGAITYAVTHMTAQTAVTAVSSGVSLGGLLVAESSRLLFGDGVGNRVASTVHSASRVVSNIGSVTSEAGAIAASTAAAAIVGGGYLIGSGLWAIWDSYKTVRTADQTPAKSPVQVSDDTEFVLISSTPLLKQETVLVQPQDTTTDCISSTSPDTK